MCQKEASSTHLSSFASALKTLSIGSLYKMDTWSQPKGFRNVSPAMPGLDAAWKVLQNLLMSQVVFLQSLICCFHEWLLCVPEVLTSVLTARNYRGNIMVTAISTGSVRPYTMFGSGRENEMSHHKCKWSRPSQSTMMVDECRSWWNIQNGH